MRSVDIHEFSTGIHVQALGDGRWVSRGFTGRYINNTIQQIPSEVEIAIANREFAVSEGAYTDEPAIIARQMPNNSPWAVVAVVSRGEDEKGRSASFYRYFLCNAPGQDGIFLILQWMTGERKRTRQWPKFDPTNPKTTPNQFQFNTEHVTDPNVIASHVASLSGKAMPYVWASANNCVPLILHELSKAYTVPNGQLTAWAYRVGALERPWNFTIIYPASENAERIITRAILNPPAVRPASGFNEQALVNALKTLTTGSAFNSDALQRVLTAAQDEHVTDDVWKALFEKRGVEKAITHGAYSSEIIKLLLMRSLLLPTTLPDLLDSAGFSKPTSKNNEVDNVLADFQSKITRATANSPAEQQIQVLVQSSMAHAVVPGIMQGYMSPESAYNLFNCKGSLWGRRVYSTLLKPLKEDTEAVHAQYYRRAQHQKNFESSELWKGVYEYYQCLLDQRFRHARSDRYQPLISLFISVAKNGFAERGVQSTAYRLAAYFSQIDEDSVPPKLYKKVSSNTKERGAQLPNSIIIYRKIPIHEQIANGIYYFFIALFNLLRKFIQLLGKHMPIFFALMLAVFTFLVGSVVGASVLEDTLFNIQKDEASDIAPSAKGASSPEMAAGVIESEALMAEGSPFMQSAIDNYGTTTASLNQLIDDISQDSTIAQVANGREDVVAELKIILGLEPTFAYDIAVQGTDSASMARLVRSIYDYESDIATNQKAVSADGIIKPNDATAQFLRGSIQSRFTSPL